MVAEKDELKKQVFDFLMEHDLSVLATTNLNGQPESATMGYLVDSDFNFSFLISKNSRKVVNILNNPLVAIVIGTSAGNNTIQIEGEAKIVYFGEPVFIDILTKITAMKSLYYSPVLETKETDFVLITVKTNWLRWLEFNKQTGREEFLQLIP